MDERGVFWRNSFFLVLVLAVVGFIFIYSGSVIADGSPSGAACTKNSDCESGYCGCLNEQNQTACCETSVGKSCTNSTECNDYCQPTEGEAWFKDNLTYPVEVFCNPFTGKCEAKAEETETCFNECQNFCNVTIIDCFVEEGVAACGVRHYTTGEPEIYDCCGWPGGDMSCGVPVGSGEARCGYWI